MAWQTRHHHGRLSRLPGHHRAVDRVSERAEAVGRGGEGESAVEVSQVRRLLWIV